MYTNDYMDAPDSRKGAGIESRGVYLFKDGLKGTKLDYIRPQSNDITTLRLTGVPYSNAAGQADIVPFLQPKPTMSLSEPVEKLFWLTNAYEMNIVDFCGPVREKRDKDDDSPKIPLVAIVDDYSPAQKRKAMQEGRRLPPTCFDILNSRATSVAAMSPRFAKYYKDPNNDYHNALKKSKRVMFVIGLCINHGYIECGPDNPVPVVCQLGWTSLSNLKKVVYAQNDGYVYPEGSTHESIATREELDRRFVVPDLVNPAGAFPIVIKSQPQKRRSDKAMGGGSKGEVKGNEYVVNVASESLAVPVELQHELYVPPEDLFWYPTPAEAFEVLLNNASEKDWLDFLLACAKGTDIEPRSRFTQGVDTTEDTPEAEPEEEAEAAPPPVAPLRAAPAATTPTTTATTLKLGAPKSAESGVHTMPLPNALPPLQPKATGAVDDPAATKDRISSMRLKLQKLQSGS